MKTSIYLSLIAGLLSSCSSPVSIAVVEPASHKPIPGIIVERHCPASTLARIINPVGTFYHSDFLTESMSTDSNGTATFRCLRSDDRLEIIDPDRTRSLLITFDGKTVRLDPPATNTKQKWGFSIQLKGGSMKTSAWERREEYARWHRLTQNTRR